MTTDTGLRQSPKIKHLLPSETFYNLFMSDKDELIIDGEERKFILGSNQNFIELKNGKVINKVYIKKIYMDIETTRQRWQDKNAS